MLNSKVEKELRAKRERNGEMREEDVIEQMVNGWNRHLLGRKLGLSVSHVSKVLNGKRMPALPIAAKIAEAMNMWIDELYRCLEAKRMAYAEMRTSKGLNVRGSHRSAVKVEVETKAKAKGKAKGKGRKGKTK